MTSIQAYTKLQNDVAVNTMMMAELKAKVELSLLRTPVSAPSAAAVRDAAHHTPPAAVTPEVPKQKRTVQLALPFVATPVSTPSHRTHYDALDFKGLRMAELLLVWYGKELYLEDITLPQAQRDMRLLMAKAVCYCKLFVAEGSKIPRRPPLDQEERWFAALGALGQEAQRGIMDFLGGGRKKPFVQGCMVHLQRANRANLLPVRNQEVVDEPVQEARACGQRCYHFTVLELK
jgi:hypothetical protein